MPATTENETRLTGAGEALLRELARIERPSDADDRPCDDTWEDANLVWDFADRAREILARTMTDDPEGTNEQLLANALLRAEIAEKAIASARAEGWKAGRDAAAKVARERSFDLRCANSGAEVMPGSCDEGDAIADIIDALEMPK